MLMKGYRGWLLLAGLAVLGLMAVVPANADTAKLSMAEARAAALEKEEGKVVDVEKYKADDDEILVFYIEKEDGKVMKVEVGRQAAKVLKSQLDYIKADTPLPEGSIKLTQAREIAKSHVARLSGMPDRPVALGAKLTLHADKPVYYFKVSVGKTTYDVKVAPEDGKVVSAVNKQTGAELKEPSSAPVKP